MGESSPESAGSSTPMDESKPHIARVYDYYLGGTDNTPADRELAAQIKQAIPEIGELAWANRGFVQRAAKWMAEQGIDQFVDIGAGLPTAGNTHSVVQQVHPDARVLYVDNDAEVVEFGTRIVERDNVRHTQFVHADLRDPQAILSAAGAGMIDFTRPVGWLIIGVLYFIADADEPWAAVSTLVDASVPGSALAISHLTSDRQAPDAVEHGVQTYKSRGIEGHLRDKAEVSRFFAGLDIVPPYPGAPAEVMHVGLWGAEDPHAAHDDASTWFYAAVARKP